MKHYVHTLQVHPGKHSRIAVVLNLASTGDAEELERERIVERHIQASGKTFCKILLRFNAKATRSLR